MAAEEAVRRGLCRGELRGGEASWKRRGGDVVGGGLLDSWSALMFFSNSRLTGTLFSFSFRGIYGVYGKVYVCILHFLEKA